MNTVSMTVIGAGSYGTALAITLACNGHHALLWGHDPRHIKKLQPDHYNQAFLPDVTFPNKLLAETCLKTAITAKSQHIDHRSKLCFNQVLQHIQPYLTL